MPKTQTYVNLQGDIDQTYMVGFYRSDKPKRETQKAVWPENAEQNFERLKKAGQPMERGIVKCNRCDGNVWLSSYIRVTADENFQNLDTLHVLVLKKRPSLAIGPL